MGKVAHMKRGMHVSIYVAATKTNTKRCRKPVYTMFQHVLCTLYQNQTSNMLPVAHACAHFDLIWPHLNNGQNGQNELNVQPCMVAIGFKSKKISFKHMFAIISMHEMHSMYLQVPNNTYFPSIFHSLLKSLFLGIYL